MPTAPRIFLVVSLSSLFILLLSSCTSPKPSKPVLQDQNTLKVMTYNVNFGLSGDLDAIDILKNTQADIVFLQETNEEWENTLRQALRETYPYLAFRHCCGAGGLAILSKYPFEEKDYLAPTVGWFPAWRILVNTPYGVLQTLNVHLRPPISEKGSIVSGYFRTPNIRLKEIQNFAPILDESLPTLIVGDFNENRRGKAIDYLTQKGFRSVLPEFDPSRTTWRWKTSVGTITHQLDHIMYNEKLNAQFAEVLEEGNSDHFPVVAGFFIF